MVSLIGHRGAGRWSWSCQDVSRCAVASVGVAEAFVEAAGAEVVQADPDGQLLVAEKRAAR